MQRLWWFGIVYLNIDISSLSVEHSFMFYLTAASVLNQLTLTSYGFETIWRILVIPKRGCRTIAAFTLVLKKLWLIELRQWMALWRFFSYLVQSFNQKRVFQNSNFFYYFPDLPLTFRDFQWLSVTFPNC